MQPIFDWISLYEYPAIFFLLLVGIVGLPVPDEILLMFVGFLVYTDKLQFSLAVASAYLGSLCGISVSYALGRWTGPLILSKLSRFFPVNPAIQARTQAWYRRKGKLALFFGYFVPGVRHLVAFAAGASRLPVPTFALFAYSGAAFWSVSFILIGYTLGEEWEQQSRTIHQTLIGLAIGIIVGILLFWLAKRRR